MSVPGSPQNEAIQHSSVSTSNGVSSSSTTPAVSAPSSAATTTSNQSTEETQSQPSGSWSSPNCSPSVNTGAPSPLQSPWQTEERDFLSQLQFWAVLFFLIYSWLLCLCLCYVYPFCPQLAMLSWKCKCFLWNWWRQKNRHFRFRLGCKTSGSKMLFFLYLCDLFINLYMTFYLKKWSTWRFDQWIVRDLTKVCCGSFVISLLVCFSRLL